MRHKSASSQQHSMLALVRRVSLSRTPHYYFYWSIAPGNPQIENRNASTMVVVSLLYIYPVCSIYVYVSMYVYSSWRKGNNKRWIYLDSFELICSYAVHPHVYVVSAFHRLVAKIAYAIWCDYVVFTHNIIGCVYIIDARAGSIFIITPDPRRSVLYARHA